MINANAWIFVKGFDILLRWVIFTITYLTFGKNAFLADHAFFQASKIAILCQG